MAHASSSSSRTLRPFSYVFSSSHACTSNPVSVVVAPIDSTTTSNDSSGVPCQFRVMWQNTRCSIFFHLLLPGGGRQTSATTPPPSAHRCNSTFHNRQREPLLPSLSAVT